MAVYGPDESGERGTAPGHHSVAVWLDLDSDLGTPQICHQNILITKPRHLQRQAICNNYIQLHESVCSLLERGSFHTRKALSSATMTRADWQLVLQVN